jgi:hypothetical protein
VFAVPAGLALDPALLPALREGRWEAFAQRGAQERLPSEAFDPRPDPSWNEPLAARFQREMARTRQRLDKLDRRHGRDHAGTRLGMDPERLRQQLFPLGLPQERVLPGLLWLRRDELLDAMEARLGGDQPIILLETPHE